MTVKRLPHVRAAAAHWERRPTCQLGTQPCFGAIDSLTSTPCSKCECFSAHIGGGNRFEVYREFMFCGCQLGTSTLGMLSLAGADRELLKLRQRNLHYVSIEQRDRDPRWRGAVLSAVVGGASVGGVAPAAGHDVPTPCAADQARQQRGHPSVRA